MSEQIIPNVVVSMPSQLFTLARKFQAASNGKIFIGKIDTDPTIPENQIQVYLENEDGTTVPVSQPLIINQAGYPVYNGQIAKFVTVQGHSMVVYDSYGSQQFYYPNVLKYDPDQLRTEIESKSGYKIIGGLSENYTRTFNTLIDAMEEKNITIGSIIKTRGYHAPDDGGGAEYFITEPNKNISDGGMFVSLTESGTQGKLIHSGKVDIATYGINRTSGDAAIAINAINKNGAVAVVNGEFIFKTLIDIDTSKGGIQSNNIGILTADADSFEEWSLGIVIHSTAEYLTHYKNNCVIAASGIIFNLSQKAVFQIGKYGSHWSNEIMISNGSIIGAKSIRFTDNAWRVVFDRVGVERCFGIPMQVDSSAVNMGEVMEFRHCWIVDNVGESEINQGQWRFYGTSLPAGAADGSGINTIKISNNATVSYDGGNIEIQPDHDVTAFDVSGVSSLSVTNCEIFQPSAGDGFKKPIITSGEHALVNLNNCALPLYGANNKTDETEAARCVISGGGVISSIGCYPKSGVLHDWNKCSILSPMINKLANCSGQWGDTRGWEVKTPGSDFSVTTSTDVPTTKMFSSSFSVWVNTGATGGMTQTVKISESGRWLQIGFWGKSDFGSSVLNVYAYDSPSSKLPWMSTGNALKLYCDNWSNEWKFYAMVQPIPAGCDSVVVEFSFPAGGSHKFHNVILGVI
ncbi:phage head-binding domain-containing protein [Morganella morganii]|uniref:phage head-binding domain-containing protein n=1 Tax=Morganella morganii TaxID=582 RepID=UPI001D137C7E|nr:phage head-binding domain-containing protein [Morganella morganii]